MRLHLHAWRTTTVGVLVVAGVAMLASPANAGVGSPDPTLLSRYFPTVGQVTVATDNYSSYVYQWTYWQTESRAANLRDNWRDAYEHEVNLLTSSGCWSLGYNRNSWDSNYPYKYLDTDASDPDYPVNRAGGSAYSQWLATGQWYYHWLRVKGKCTTKMWYTVAGQDSHRSKDIPCGSTYHWCVFGNPGNPRDIVPSTANLETGRTYQWRYQHLYNDGFEDGTAGWTLRAAAGYYPYWRVVTSTAAVDRSKYLTFNCKGSPGCHIYQYASSPVTSDDIWTAEVALRCHPSSSTASGCPISLGISGYGVTPVEHVSRGFSVPNDGKWHIYGWRGSQYSTHNRMRFIVTNDSTNNTVDVDLTTLHRSDRY